jgi:hypothetical protein
VALVAEHWAQAPLAWQAGVAPLQSESLPHARQVCVAPLQIGVAPKQSAFARQVTQVLVVVKHKGVAPEQAVALVAEHCAQAPLP